MHLAAWRVPPAAAAGVPALPPSSPALAAQLLTPLAARRCPGQLAEDPASAAHALTTTGRHRSRRQQRRGGGGSGGTCTALPPLLPSLEEPEESYVRLQAPEGGAEIHLFGVIHGGNESEVAEFIMRERPEVGWEMETPGGPGGCDPSARPSCCRHGLPALLCCAVLHLPHAWCFASAVTLL